MSDLTKEYNDLNAKFNEDISSFSNTLQSKHINDAVTQLAAFDKLQQKVLSHDGFQKPQAKLQTVKLFKNQFAFPQIALNDFAVEQLEVLEEAEKKLQSHLNDPNALGQFMATAGQVAEKLKHKYKK